MDRPLGFICLAVWVVTFWPMARFWASTAGTALRGVAAWAVIAWAGQGIALWLSLGSHGDLSVAAARLLADILLLAPIVALLGARRPRHLAWNLIVLSLLLILALPLLEHMVLGRERQAGRATLDGPRWLIYAIVAGIGIVNYLPTRFGLPAMLFATGLALRATMLGPWSIALEWVVWFERLSLIVLTGCCWAAWMAGRALDAMDLQGAWQRFRDAWGLVWALRLKERWNQEARRLNWPVRLAWRGLRPAETGNSLGGELPAEAVRYFRFLLRRFADPDRWGPASDKEQ